jgi:hypothetical protein
MMGHRSKRFKLFTETNLEALVPADNFYRRLEGCLDLCFVRELVRDRYEEGGRPSIDPVVFFILRLVAAAAIAGGDQGARADGIRRESHARRGIAITGNSKWSR